MNPYLQALTQLLSAFHPFGEPPKVQASPTPKPTPYDVAHDPAFSFARPISPADRNFLNNVSPQERQHILDQDFAGTKLKPPQEATPAPAASPKPKATPEDDPLFAGEGTIDFTQPHPQYGDTYTDRREVVQALAKRLAAEGYTIGSTGPGMWVVKSHRAKGAKR